MNESILDSIKKLLGISNFDGSFDEDIIVAINSVLSVLWQMGVGPENGFRITGPQEKWSDYISDLSNIEFLKTYIHLRVAQIFDPPSSSSVAEAANKLIAEMEWRLFSAAEGEKL